MSTELHDAVKKGDIYKIKKLIAQGFPVNKRDGLGNTAVYTAAENGKLDILGYLVNKCGADPDSADYYGDTALHYVANKGYINAVRYLIKNCGANPNNANNIGETPLHKAVENGCTNTIHCLITECGVDPNIRNEKNGYTALHEAASFYANTHEVENTIHCLVTLGADLTAIDKNGQTPYDIARVEKTKKLLLSLAAEQEIKKKRQTETKIAQPISSSKFPLHNAATKGDVAEIRKLVKKGFSVYEQNEKGRIPLHEAARHGQVNAIYCLINEFDVNPNTTHQKDGDTCLHYAAFGGHLDAIHCFIDEFHLNPNAVNQKNGWTPLHCAAFDGDVDTILCLVKFGVDVNAIDIRGRTPFDVANTKEKKNLLRTLATEQEAKKKQQQTPSSTPKTPEELLALKPNKPLPTPPRKQQPKTSETIQAQLQKELSVAPRELVENVQAELKETKEKYDQITSAIKNYEEQLETLKRNQINPEEIKEIQKHLVILERDRKALEPITALQHAKNDSIALFAQNPNALEFYNTSYAFLKAFFDGISAAYNPVISKESNGLLNTAASIIGKLKGWVSFLPLGSTIFGLFENQLTKKDLEILKKRIKSLTLLSQHPEQHLELPLLIEKIAHELTIRHEDSIIRIDNTQSTPGKLKQMKDEFFKDGELSSVQNLAEFAVSMMIGDLLEGKKVSTANLQDRCLAAVLKVSSSLGFITKKVESFFSKNVVKVKINNQSITTQNYHYRDFFTKLNSTPVARNQNNNNATLASTVTPTVTPKIVDVTTRAPEVEFKMEIEKLKEQLQQKADAEHVTTLAEKHEKLSVSYSHVQYGLSKLEKEVKKENKPNATSVDVGSSQAQLEMPLESPTRYSSDAFGSPIHTRRLDEFGVELQKEREKNKKLEEKLELLTDKLEILEEEKTNGCVPKGCSII